MLIRNLIVGVMLGIALVTAPVALAAPPIASASAAAAFVAPSGLKPVTQTAGTITSQWTAVANAPQYELQISAKSDMSSAMYYRTTSTSANVGGLEAATTYYFRVRVTSPDSTLNSPWSKAVSIRTNFGHKTAAMIHPLAVGSYNVLCSTCFQNAGTEPWSVRSGAVVQAVKDQGLDVIGFQEAAEGIVPGTTVAQFEDLQTKLTAAGTGLVITRNARHNCVNPMTSTGCVYKDQGASHGSRIFYNKNTVDLISSGAHPFPVLSGASREAAWAILSQKSTGKQFIYVNAHLEYRGEPVHAAQRVIQMESIVEFVKNKNATMDLPVFIVGDLNSTKWSTPSNGPYDVLTSAGYSDPIGNVYGNYTRNGEATAEKITNANYGTFNGLRSDITPSKTYGNGSHLDYIWTSGMRVGEWKMVLNNGGSGNAQVGVIPSDHNMLTAKVQLPGEFIVGIPSLGGDASLTQPNFGAELESGAVLAVPEGNLGVTTAESEDPKLSGNSTMKTTIEAGLATPDLSGASVKTPLYRMVGTSQPRSASAIFRNIAPSSFVLTRNTMAAHLYRIAGSPTYVPPATSRFSDVTVDDPYYKAISWVVENGISDGYANGSYRPWSFIEGSSREAFFTRYHDQKDKELF